jgi:hypothetical protein
MLLVPLADTKTYIWVIWTSEDAKITSLIEKSQAIISGFLGYEITSSEKTLYFNWCGQRELILWMFWIVSLTSFKYNSWTRATPVWTVFDRETYEIDTDKWIIYLDFCLFKGFKNIQVVVNQWYTDATIPKEIQVAILKIVAQLYINDGTKDDSITSESVDGDSVTRAWWIDSEKLIKWDVRTILESYKFYHV